MTYTLNDNPIIPRGQCGGTNKNGTPCKRVGYNVLQHGFWCPAHGDVFGPNEEQEKLLEARYALPTCVICGLDIKWDPITNTNGWVHSDTGVVVGYAVRPHFAQGES